MANEINMSNDVHEVRVADLHEYENNPRSNDHAVDEMAALIEAHGFRVPILYRIEPEGTLRIVDGHLRVKALRKLGIATVPAIDVSDMDEAMVRAFRIAVNRASDLADWDYTKLSDELQSLKQAFDDEDMPRLTGFDDSLMSIMASADGLEPLPTASKPSTPLPRTQSADKATVRSEMDRVNLMVSMTVQERTKVLEKLDEVRNRRGLETRAEALLHILEHYKEPARNRRAKAST